MAVDMSQLLDLYGAAAIRDWVKANFLKKSDAEGMMASKLKITFGFDFVGLPYTITGGENERYTGTVPTSRIVEQTIKTLDTTYTVTCATANGDSHDSEIVVGNFYGIYPCDFYTFRAVIAFTADVGATVTAVCGDLTYTRKGRGPGDYVYINVRKAGTYALTATLNGKTTSTVTVDVTTVDKTYVCDLPILLPTIVPWATGTDEEIVAMVAAMDAGILSVEGTGWHVGDERTVSLSAMDATGVGESHVAMAVALVLGNVGGKSFEDGTECHFVVLQKDLLKEPGYMNDSGTNNGGWKDCARRTWCNDVYSAAIPATLLPIFKRFKNISGAGGGVSSGTQETVDLFALAGEGEIFGSRTYASPDEVSAETQFEWYKTFENLVKRNYYGSSATSPWWERSPNSDNSSDFCYVRPFGDAVTMLASEAQGLAPFGCI